MNNASDKWTKLAKWARQTPAEPVTEPPFGFSARVVARWIAGDVPENGWTWEFFSRRALAVAAAVMIVSVGLNYDWLYDGWTNETAWSQATLELLDLP